MSYDPEVANSSGYFKDPVTKENLSPDTPRVVRCEFKDGKFTWPMVLASDCTQLLRIVYRLFTDEEKDLYRAYRGREVRERPEPVPVTEDTVEEDAGSLLAKCDSAYGTAIVGGVMYGLVGRRDGGEVHAVPRAEIPAPVWDILCLGGEE